MRLRPSRQVHAAIEAISPDLPWEAVAPAILPVFERLAGVPLELERPVRVVLPPGVSVGFGIDLGPGFVRVTSALLASWNVTPDQLAVRAVFNLRQRAAMTSERDVVRGRVGDLAIAVFQSGDGWASVLLLVPDVLARIFGARAQLVMAPTRDLVATLPADTDRRLAASLRERLAGDDPNALCLEAFTLREGTLVATPLGAGARA